MLTEIVWQCSGLSLETKLRGFHQRPSPLRGRYQLGGTLMRTRVRPTCEFFTAQQCSILQNIPA
jgi:hypothetical protein